MIDDKLMKGNWVGFKHHKKQPPTPVKIIELWKKECLVEYLGNEMGLFYASEEIVPLELSPLILRACGFKKHNNSNEFWTFWTLDNGWYIAQSHHSELSAGVKSDLFYWGDEYREITSLHDLQNLYYILTKKELVYSPNTK